MTNSNEDLETLKIQLRDQARVLFDDIEKSHKDCLGNGCPACDFDQKVISFVDTVMDKLYPDKSLSTPTESAGDSELTPIQKGALALYKPPFKPLFGYIYDGGEDMVVSDDGHTDLNKNAIISRVRNWGHIQYLNEFPPEKLQDAVAEHIAQAFTEYWEKYGDK